MKEIEVELANDTDRDALKKRIDEALGADDSTLWLNDKSGREICVPSARIGYIELGPSKTDRRIGFGA